MKLTIIGSRGIPARYGGFEVFTEILSQKLVEKGYEVTVACEFSENPINQYKGVNLIYFPSSPPSSYLLRKFYEFFNDLYFMIITAKTSNIQYILGMTSGSSIFIPKLINPKLKVLINIDGVEWKRSKFTFLEKCVLLFNTLFGMAFTDIIVIDSKEMKHYIPKIIAYKSEYIPYGVSKPEDIPWNPDLLKECNLDARIIKKNDFFLIVARLEPENNIHIIIEGYCKSKISKPLVVIGNFTDIRYKNRIKKMVQNHSNIFFVGGIYDNIHLLNMFRQNCYAYFHGHSVGGTNPSLLEAIIMKNQIIAHKNEFNEEVCGNYAYYFTDANDIVKIILLICENHSQFSTDICIHNLMKNYSWEKIIQYYISIFDKVLKNTT